MSENYIISEEERRIKMKVAIPVNEKNIDSKICISFGRTPYYAIYDTLTKEIVYLDNTAAESSSGAGIKAAQILIDNHVEVIISPRYGENAALIINNAKIKSYKNICGSIMDNIKAYDTGLLEVLTDIHPGFKNHGNK